MFRSRGAVAIDLGRARSTLRRRRRVRRQRRKQRCPPGGGGGGGGGTVPSVDLVDAFPGSPDFDFPVKLVQHPTNDDRWYVVEQGGLIKTFLGSNPGSVTTVADVESQMGLSLG